MSKYDITILTDHRYVAPKIVDEYIQNVLDEDRLLQKALEKNPQIPGFRNPANPSS